MKDPFYVPIFFFQSAEHLSLSNIYPPALANYKKAIETNTSDSSQLYLERMHSKYGLALVHEGLFEEAIIPFENVLKVSPNDRFSLNNIVYCHYCLGRVEKALEEYEHIIKK